MRDEQHPLDTEDANNPLKAPLHLLTLDFNLSVCQCATAPTYLFEEEFCCIMRTDEEVSVVCETAKAPSDATSREDGWRAFKVCGPLDFGLVGILATISSALADASIPLFAISTYDTDYVLVKSDTLEYAAEALSNVGCIIDKA